MKKSITILALIILTIGCNQEEIKTVKYYMKNKEEMKDKLEYCKNSADRKKTTNCINASDANAQLFINDFTAIPDELKN